MTFKRWRTRRLKVTSHWRGSCKNRNKLCMTQLNIYLRPTVKFFTMFLTRALTASTLFDRRTPVPQSKSTASLTRAAAGFAFNDDRMVPWISVTTGLDIATGFCDLNGEHWLGNANLHAITTARPYQLRVDLEDWEGNLAYAEYTTFSVASEEDGFRLRVSGYSGTAGTGMNHNNNWKFSTPDRDQDNWPYNCAQKFASGWWYQDCSQSHINNPYHSSSNCEHKKGIVWYNWKGLDYSLKATSMKLKPA